MNSNSLMMKWNVDANGNPTSVKIDREVQQVSPTHNIIQLTQIPDNHYRVNIVGVKNSQAIELIEVLNKDEITEGTFFVEYSSGTVLFSENWAGQTVICSYYGRGVMLISDARIFHKNGETFYDTYDNIMKRGKDAVELLEASGGLKGAIDTINNKIEEGTQVADRLEDFITETQFYGYTITLSREAFVVKADENGEVDKIEMQSVLSDVVVYQGAKQITPVITLGEQQGCTFTVKGQRISLQNIDVNYIKASAIVNIDCGDGLVAQRVLEVTKVFDGVNQYQAEMTNGFFSFQSDSTGKITDEQSVNCEVTVTKANMDYTGFKLEVQNLPSGLNYEIKENVVTFTATKGATLKDNGSCLVVITVDGVVINKTFVWSKNKQGASAKSLTVVGSQVLRYETSDYSDIPTPYRSTITAQISGLSGTPKWYVLNNEEWQLLEGMNSTTITFIHNDAIIWGDRKETTLKCELEGYSDEITIVKLATGASGSDAYTVFLTNESVTLPMDESGIIPEYEIKRSYTKVVAYKGGAEVVPTITVPNSDLYSVVINKNIITLDTIEGSLSTVNIDINIEIDGLTFTKVWSIGKAKQGATGANGESGSTYIVNVSGGTRSITYSQINHDPRPANSQTFYGELYKDGNLVTENVGWYWVANGHFEGTGIANNFTPTIKSNFDENVQNNSISVMVTHEGNTLTYIVPVSVTKDANGLDWVQDWDSTKAEVRGNLILTPKLFAGAYDQENDLITGVAIGQDVLNNGRTIGVVGYQNNVPTFVLDTDGSVMIGNPFEENSTGLYYDNGELVAKVHSLTIQGVEVPTSEEITTVVDEKINSAKNELLQEFEDVSGQIGELGVYVDGAMKDGILDEVERSRLNTLFESIGLEVGDIDAQFVSITQSPHLSNVTILNQLTESYNSYINKYEEMETVFGTILEGTTIDVELVGTFNLLLEEFTELGKMLRQVMTDALSSISVSISEHISEQARQEVRAEIEDVSNSLADLEVTMNGEFKTGLVLTMNLTTLQSKLSQLETEKADIDGQYKGIIENPKLGTTSRTNLTNAKGELDTAHDQLIAKINSTISDSLMTEIELAEINRLITQYAQKLKAYSEVAQQCNADIALNLAQSSIEALNQQDIFNKLTNNGEVQGIYLQNNKVYINGEYINSRNFKAVRNDGTETFKIDSDGNVTIKAKNFTLTGDAVTNVATQDYVNTQIENVTNKNITFTLSNEFQVIPTDESYYPLEEQTYTIDIYGYRASEEITDFTIGKVTATKGVTAVVSGHSVIISVNPNSSLNTSSGYVDIPITYNGKSYNKRWSWAVSKQGSQVVSVQISGTQVFKYTNNYTGTPSPSSITLTANVYNTTDSGKWQYYNETNSTWTDWLNGSSVVTSKTLTVSPTSATLPTLRRVLVRYLVNGMFDTFTVVAVSDGATGATGTTGVGVSSITEYYLATNLNSGVTTSTSGWTTSIQAITSTKKYLWNYEVTRYTNNETVSTSPKIIGVYGDKGDKGDTGSTGATGNGISKITNYYLASPNNSNITTSTNGWTTTVQTITSSKKYLWNYEVITYTNGNTHASTPTIIGTYGDKGDKGDTGATGVGISKITEYYLATSASSNVTTSTSGWTTTVQSMTATNKYLWNYEIINYTDGTSKQTNVRIIGVYGDKGQTGASGVSITGVVNYYLATNSNTGVTVNTSGWTTGVQSVSSTKKYLWNYEVVSYSNGTSLTTDPCIIGSYGDKGDKGDTGASGVSITSVDVEYYLSTSATSLAGGSWSTTAPTWVSGKYMWSRTKTTYSSGSPTYSNPACITGQQGQVGATGATGKGVKSIVEQYYHSTSMTTLTGGSWSTTAPTPVSGKFIWTRSVITYTDDTTTTTAHICTTGATGAQGATGATGATGKGIKSIVEYYLVSTSNSGVTTSTSGWATSVPTMTATNRYLWNYEVITYTDNTNMTTTPKVIGVYGDKGQTGATGATGNGISSVANYYLASTSNAGVTTATSGWTTTVQAITSTKKYLWNYEKVTYTNGDVYTSTPCIIGTYGEKGDTGATGADAYTVILSNENHTFTSNSSGNITTAQSTTTTVTAYKGASTVGVAIGTLPTVSGLTLSKNGSVITIQANTGTGLAETGTFNIPLTIDGKSFTKTFSWSKAKQGVTGATGASGVGVSSIVEQYYLSTSRTSVTGGSWSTTAPTASKGKYIWTRSVITYTNSTTSTTNAICVSGEDGVNGATGASGVSITSVDVEYAQNTSSTTAPTSGWVTTAPTWANGKYIWSRTKTTYSNGNVTTSNPACITGQQGATGATGQAGANAKAVDILASSMVFKSADGGTTFAPDTITLTPKLQNLTYSNWQYSTNGGSTWSGLSNSITGWSVSNSVLTINKSCSLFTKDTTSVVFRLNTTDSSFYDVITIVKLYDVTELEVGSRNILTGTSTPKTMTGNNTSNQCADVYSFVNKDSSLVAGKKVTLQFKYSTSNGATGTFRFQTNGSYNSSATTQSGFWTTIGGTINVANNPNGLVTFTTDVSEEALNRCTGIQVRKDNFNGTLTISEVILVTGNKVTDWSPAPEDVEQNVEDKIEDYDTSLNQLAVFNKLTNNGVTQGIYLQDSKLYINGEYIKASSISGNKISANSITADKIASNVLSASTIVSTINGGSTNITGNRIRTGSISSTNGKSVINLDSGAMNLGATSDSSYFQWTGSALNIKASSISIGTSSVATSTDVTTAINNVQIGGRNLIIEKDLTKGWIDNAGNLVVDSLYVVTHFIPCTENEKFIFQMWLPSVAQVWYDDTYFDSNKNYIGGYSSTYSTSDYICKECIAPKNAGYIRVSYRYHKDYKYKLERGGKATDWSPSPEDVKADITTAKDDAISSASADATNKVNTAKAELNTVINKKANSVDVYTKSETYTKSQTDSAINVAKEEINLGVSTLYETKENVTTKINNIEVGGTNLVLNSDFSNGKTNWSGWSIHPTITYKNKNVIHSARTGLTADSWAELRSNKIDTKEGETFTMSVDVKWENIPSGENSMIAIWGYDSNGANRKSLKEKSITGSQDWNRVVLTGTVPTGVTQIRACMTHRRNGSIYATNFKLEKGNKVTGWSPSPEDVTSSISNAKTEAISSANSTLTETIKNYYTKTQTDSAINVAKDAINLSVSNTYETKANVTTKVNSAISTASSDATSKANTALNNAKSYADTKKTEAINSANSTLTETLKSYSTTAQMNSAINVAKNEINSSVSSTYETKTNVTSKINAIEIGSRNLATKNSITLHGTGNIDKTNFTKNGSFTVSRTSGTNGGFNFDKGIIYRPSTSYRVRCYITKTSGSINNILTHNGLNHATVKVYLDGKVITDSTSTSAIFNDGKAHEFKMEFTTASTIPDSNSGTNQTFVQPNKNDSATHYSMKIESFKLEQGTNYSDWTPAPEDVESSITSLQTRMNTAEQKITDSAIINTVSSTFVTKTDFNNLAIGGGNLITNSNFQYGLEGWTGSNAYFSVTADNLLHYNVTNLTEAKNYQKYCDPVDVTQIVGKQVTVSVDFKVVDKSILGSNTAIAYVRFFNNDTSTSQADSLAYENLRPASNYVNNTWGTATTTITVPTGAKYMRVAAYVSQNGTIYWRRFKVEQGNRATSWCPAVSDAVMYVDSVSNDIATNLSDLSQIVTDNTGSDAITSATKVQLVAEFDDITAIYNKLNSIYSTLGDSSMSSLQTGMTTAYNAVKTLATNLNSSISEVSTTGLASAIEKYSAFYKESEEFHTALTNSTTNKTIQHGTELKQLADSVSINATKMQNIESDVTTLTTNFIFDTDGLTIKSSKNATKTIKLDNDSLDFLDNGHMVAQISDNKLTISNSEVSNQMKIGNILIKPSGKGGLMFVYQ